MILDFFKILLTLYMIEVIFYCTEMSIRYKVNFHL